MRVDMCVGMGYRHVCRYMCIDIYIGMDMEIGLCVSRNVQHM